MNQSELTTTTTAEPTTKQNVDDNVDEVLFDFLPPIGDLKENSSTSLSLSNDKPSSSTVRTELDDIFGTFSLNEGADIKTNNQFDDIINLDDGLNNIINDFNDDLNINLNNDININFDDGLNLNDINFDTIITTTSTDVNPTITTTSTTTETSNLFIPKFQQKNITNPNSPSRSFNNQEPQLNSYNRGGDYSRSYFESTLKDQQKTKSSSDIFGDILDEQGYKFESKLNQGSKSINEMRKDELIRDMDPDKLKIFNWTNGKKNNIRALLCSMDKIIWDNSKWTKCEMHQLITSSDVRKAYRKACLAVHPDKQIGTKYENIAKMMFMELNNAWSEFEKDNSSGCQQKLLS